MGESKYTIIEQVLRILVQEKDISPAERNKILDLIKG